MSDSEFYNPYQFIPVTGRIKEGNKAKESETFDYKDIAEGEDSPVRHDIWHKDGLSGSIKCTLTLESPTFVGGQRKTEATDNNPAEVEHYLRNKLPAIPGNSLRGMIGSLVEALSQSTLRVLGNNNYSTREAAKQAEQKAKKIGRIVKEGNSFSIKKLEYFTVEQKNIEQPFCKGQDYFYCELEKKVYRNNNPEKSLIKGQLRILDVPKKELPNNRKFEIFVYDIAPESQPLSLAPSVIDSYEQLCKERWDATKNSPNRQPYLYKGWQGKAGLDPWQVQEGLLLYYCVGKQGVQELSCSQIWRENMGKNAHDFFHAINPALLPWGSPGREQLSIAERLLGVAEDLSLQPEDNSNTARNLASRVRFSDALPCGDEDLNDWEKIPTVTLRILASPKPPSPALYFKKAPDGKLPPTKQQLKTKNFTPNGRKYYLHHPEAQIADVNWESQTGQKNMQQKVKVKPLSEGSFFFNVEFDNLSKAELSLLQTALNPDDNFYHRLGMGRSLGLGKVKISTELNLIDRKRIYGRNGKDNKKSSGLYETFSTAKKTDSNNTDDNNFIDQDTLDILKLLGDPSKLKQNIDVRPPLPSEQVERQNWEDEGFRWFVHNDKQHGRNRQYLKIIQPGAAELPTLWSRADGKELIDLPELSERNLSDKTIKTVKSPKQSAWLKEKLEELGYDKDKTTKPPKKLLKQSPLAQKWAELGPEERETELARLQVHWRHHDIEPNREASKIYYPNSVQSSE